MVGEVNYVMLLLICVQYWERGQGGHTLEEGHKGWANYPNPNDKWIGWNYPIVLVACNGRSILQRTLEVGTTVRTMN